MASATRLLLRLRSISRPLPPAHIPGSCSSAAQLGNCVLHCSPPGMRELHVLPRAVPNVTLGRIVTNVTLGRIAFDVVINAGVGLYVMKRIDNWGHLGGLLAGVVVECFVGPHWKKLGVAEDRTKVIQDRAPLARLINGGIRPQKTVFTETEEGLFAK